MSVEPPIVGAPKRPLEGEDIRSPSGSYVNVVYASGPPGSFAWIQPGLPGDPHSDEEGFGAREPSISLRSKPDGDELNELIAFYPNGGSRLYLHFNGNNSGECDVELFRIPFNYTIPGELRSGQSFATVAHDHRNWKAADPATPSICDIHQGRDVTEEVARRTELVRGCAPYKMRKCLHLYQAATQCDAYWKNIADGLISIHSYAQFLTLSVRCFESGVDLRRAMATIRSDSLHCSYLSIC